MEVESLSLSRFETIHSHKVHIHIHIHLHPCWGPKQFIIPAPAFWSLCHLPTIGRPLGTRAVGKMRWLLRKWVTTWTLLSSQHLPVYTSDNYMKTCQWQGKHLTLFSIRDLSFLSKACRLWWKFLSFVWVFSILWLIITRLSTTWLLCLKDNPQALNDQSRSIQDRAGYCLSVQQLWSKNWQQKSSPSTSTMYLDELSVNQSSLTLTQFIPDLGNIEQGNYFT